MVTPSSVATPEAVDDNASYYGQQTTMGILNRLFNSCAAEPKNSVHRAWGLTLIFLIVFFVLSVVEMVNLKSAVGSRALVLASVMTGLVHLILGILGTFVLKRFPTSFSIGFFLGVLVVLANQNLILTGTFFGYPYGNPQTNRIFANLSLFLFLVLTFFALMLFHFKADIVVSPIDTKHHHHPPVAAAAAASPHSNNNRPPPVSPGEEDNTTLDYSQYEEPA